LVRRHSMVASASTCARQSFTRFLNYAAFGHGRSTGRAVRRRMAVPMVAKPSVIFPSKLGYSLNHIGETVQLRGMVTARHTHGR
jgi:hypothetical protein